MINAFCSIPSLAPEHNRNHLFDEFVFVYCCQVDVLVNSVKSNLDLSCGAISNALRKAAGPELQRACKEYTSCLNPSEVLVTRPGNLPCKYVIHVVCYSWNATSTDKCEEVISEENDFTSYWLAVCCYLQSVVFMN